MRDELVATITRWNGYLRAQVREAQVDGDIDARVDPDDIVQALTGFVMVGNQAIQLLCEDPVRVRERTRRLMRAALGSARLSPAAE